MLEIFQKTINNPISIEGVGLHSGNKSKITILPGNIDQGIVFRRIDLKENNLVEANYESVSSAKLCTTLENKNGVKVSTVEHLLAAIYIAEIDNAIVEIETLLQRPTLARPVHVPQPPMRFIPRRHRHT